MEEGSADSDSPEEDGTRCLMSSIASKGRKRLPTASVVLGSYAFTAVGDPGLNRWAGWLSTTALPAQEVHAFFRHKLGNDLYQVPDPALTAIARECTQVAARVQLGALDDEGKPTKSVEHGPFYSEYLPSESLLVALVESAAPDHIPGLTRLIHGDVIQVGGDETIGKGLMWCTLAQPVSDGGPHPESRSSGDQVAEGARP